jgi:hypothetical protein
MAQKAWHEIDQATTLDNNDLTLIDRLEQLNSAWINYRLKLSTLADFIGGNQITLDALKAAFGNLPGGLPTLDGQGLLGVAQGRVASVNGQERNSLGAITVTAPSITMADAVTTVEEAIQARVRINQIVNSLASGGTQVPLSAEMGKDLEGRKINYADSINDLITGGASVPLSAEMGKALQDTKINVADIVNNLASGGSLVPLSAEMGKTLSAMVADARRSTHMRGTVMSALAAPAWLHYHGGGERLCPGRRAYRPCR